jgi:hypothetical protein
MAIALVIIEILVNMKTTALILASFLLTRFATAAVDLGLPSAGTPYDRYMSPVKHVLSQIDGQKDQASMDRVKQLMVEGRRFRYSFTNPYTPSLPEETAARHAGDCKDKALWLANQLNDPNVRFVIGKARANSKISHAWLVWQHDNRYWILDCTNNYQPVSADKVSKNEYIPFYSYTRNGAFRHDATRTMFADVAAKNTVAAR